MLQLMKPTMELKEAYLDYIEEWEASTEKIVPFASGRRGKTFEELLEDWELFTTNQAYEKGWVPASIYFLYDDEVDKIIGASHIRHELNDYLLSVGGHIGYGVRPSERKKGYATTMLKLSLEKAKELGIKKVLVTCDKTNMASSKTILNNGGQLENEFIEEDVNVVMRYWIFND